MARPVFGVASVALPVVVAALGALWLAVTSNGNARMGIAIFMIAAMGLAGVVGAVLGAVALVRGEQVVWPALLGLLLNLGLAITVTGFLFKQ